MAAKFSKLDRASRKGIRMTSVVSGNVLMSRQEQGAAVNLAYSMFGVFLLSMAVYMGTCVKSLAASEDHAVIASWDGSSAEY